MSIITEDGTGKSDAETYISVADATAYHAARGNAAWAALATDALREQALRRANDYMAQAYTSRWQGCRTYPTVQALDWPRAGVVVNDTYVDSDEVPETVKRACAELALKASSADLLADQKQAKTSVTIGPIRTDFDRTSPQRVRYPAVDALLLPYLKAGGGCCVGLVRT